MDRKDFLSIWKQNRLENRPSPLAGLDPYNGPWTQKQAVHLLRRLLFGVKKVDVDKVLSQGMTNALKDLLQLTDGNLATHLKSLEDAGYISVTKEFIVSILFDGFIAILYPFLLKRLLSFSTNFDKSPCLYFFILSPSVMFCNPFPCIIFNIPSPSVPKSLTAPILSLHESEIMSL